MSDLVLPSTPEPSRIRYRVGDWAKDNVDLPGHWFDLHVEQGHLLHDSKNGGRLAKCWLDRAYSMGVARVLIFGRGILGCGVGAFCERDEARKVVVVFARRISELLAEVTSA